MKLSDISGDKTIDALAELIEPVSNIAMDEKVAKILKKKQVPDGVDKKDFAMSIIKSNFPSIIKNHKNDIIKIMSVLSGVTEKEYTDSLTIPKFIKDVTELFTDEDFVGFLS